MDDKIYYAKNNGIHIAYRVFGKEAEVDCLFVPTWWSNLDLVDEHPAVRKALESITEYARLIVVDRRGSGLSDRLCGIATLEEGMDDLLAVLDDLDIERVGLFGLNESGPLCMMLAGTHPQRVSHLMLYGTFATTVQADDYPWAPTPEERQLQIDFLIEHWGETDLAGLLRPPPLPSPAGDRTPDPVEDRMFAQWAGRWMRNSVSKDALPQAYDILAKTDVRSILETINVPTLILHRKEDPVVPIDNGRYLANKIPSARLVELEGGDSVPFLGDWDSIAAEIEEFLTGHLRQREADRVLATILITDIVDSSRRAAELGDREWRRVLDQHDLLGRRQVERFQGRVVKNTGDGFLATFDGPARAMRCAYTLRDSVKDLGVRIRAGLHTGEVERRGEDIGGIAVHIAARVSAVAGPDEVLVSSAVPPLVAGAGVAFEDAGVHSLRGIDGEWRLYRVAGC